jgi:hypothetical protein
MRNRTPRYRRRYKVHPVPPAPLRQISAEEAAVQLELTGRGMYGVRSDGTQVWYDPDSILRPPSDP